MLQTPHQLEAPAPQIVPVNHPDFIQSEAATRVTKKALKEAEEFCTKLFTEVPNSDCLSKAQLSLKPLSGNLGTMVVASYWHPHMEKGKMRPFGYRLANVHEELEEAMWLLMRRYPKRLQAAHKKALRIKKAQPELSSLRSQ